MKSPRQSRSEETLRNILQACDVLLKDRSFEEISMQDIAAEAGVSVGNLYNRFHGRDELVLHVMEQHQHRFQERLANALKDAPADLSLRARLDLLAEAFSNGINGLRPVFASMVARNMRGESGSAAASNTGQIIESAVEWLMQGKDEIKRQPQKDACTFAVCSIAFNQQFDLLFGTATRLFGKRYNSQLAEQAYQYLVSNGETS